MTDPASSSESFELDRLAGQQGAGRIVRGLVLAGFTLAVFVCAGILCVVEALAFLRADTAGIDPDEMETAIRLIPVRSQQLESIDTEHALITQLLNSRVEEINTPAVTDQATSSSPNHVPLPSKTMRDVDVIDDHCRRVKNGSFQLSALEQLTPQQRDEVASRVRRMLAFGLVKPNSAIDVISIAGSEKTKAQFLRDVMAAPDLIPMFSHSRHPLDLVESLPGPERAQCIITVAYCSTEYQMRNMASFARAIGTIETEHAPLLAPLLASRYKPIRTAVLNQLNGDQKWEIFLKAFGGREIAMLQTAMEWIATQTVNDEHRTDVLKGLGDIIWFGLEREQPVYRVYCKWADSSVAEALSGIVTGPIPESVDVDVLIETAIRCNVPVETLLESAKLRVQSSLQRRYLDDPSVREAVATFLTSDTNLDNRYGWLQFIAQSGTSEHVADVQDATEYLRRTLPGSVVLSRADTLLEDMRNRLNLTQ